MHAFCTWYKIQILRISSHPSPPLPNSPCSAYVQYRFVYGILFGYFLFFNTFPVNMALQYARWGKWSDYRYGEFVYILLSLWSKSLLAWLVFGGTAQPNGETGSGEAGSGM